MLLRYQRTIGNQATMQMKKAVLDSWMGAHMREFDNATNTVKEDKMVGPKIKHGQEIEHKEVDDASGKWAKIEVDGTEGFVRKDKVKEPKNLSTMSSKAKAAKAGGTWGQAEAFSEPETAADNVNDVFDIATKGTGGQSEVLKDASGKLKDKIKDAADTGVDDTASKEQKGKIDREDQKLGTATGLMDAGSGFIGLYGMKKSLAEAKSGSDKAAAVYSGVESTQKVVAGTSAVIDNAAKLNGSEKGVGASEAVAGYAGSIGDALASIKSAFFAVKGVFELFKEHFAGDGVSKGEAFRGGVEAIQNGLESAQSAVKTVKSILEIMELGTGKLAEVIPGLGIAISGVKITIKVYDMIQASIAKEKMTAIKRNFKEKYSDKADARPEDKKGIVKENKYTMFGKTLWTSKGTDKEKLAARREALKAKADKTADEEAEINDIQEYELAKEMKYINQKRLNRGGMQIGLEMMSMAGDIATLSGAGSAVGISLKAAAAGTKAGMGIARRIKQYGRDKAAKEGGAWSSVFNAEKSSDKKYERRSKDAELILEMIAKLPDNVSDESAKKQYMRVEQFIEASGCSTKALYKLNGNIDEQRKLLMESMSKRE